jgi:RND family efflux transporter MFP subunit
MARFRLTPHLARAVLALLLSMPATAFAQDGAAPGDSSGGSPTESMEPAEPPGVFKPFPVVFEARQKAVLSAERAGSLTSLKADVGDTVKKGAVVAQVDLGEAALRKKRGEVALQHLDKQIQELTQLNQRGLATNEEVQKVRMERDVTQADVQIYKRQIAQSTIRAPFSGMVVRRHVEAHEWVTAGQPVLDMVNLDRIRAIANLPAHIAVRLKKGDTHTLYVHDLEAELKGTVDAVAPEVDERSNTAQVIWSVDAGDRRLLPGMKGEVRVEP